MIRLLVFVAVALSVACSQPEPPSPASDGAAPTAVAGAEAAAACEKAAIDLEAWMSILFQEGIAVYPSERPLAAVSEELAGSLGRSANGHEVAAIGLDERGISRAGAEPLSPSDSEALSTYFALLFAQREEIESYQREQTVIPLTLLVARQTPWEIIVATTAAAAAAGFVETTFVVEAFTSLAEPRLDFPGETGEKLRTEIVAWANRWSPSLKERGAQWGHGLYEQWKKCPQGREMLDALRDRTYGDGVPQDAAAARRAYDQELPPVLRAATMACDCDFHPHLVKIYYWIGWRFGYGILSSVNKEASPSNLSFQGPQRFLDLELAATPGDEVVEISLAGASRWDRAAGTLAAKVAGNPGKRVLFAVTP